MTPTSIPAPYSPAASGALTWPPSAAATPFTYQTGVSWHIFTRGQTIGLSIQAVSGLCSLIAVTGVLGWVVWREGVRPWMAARRRRRAQIQRERSGSTFSFSSTKPLASPLPPSYIESQPLSIPPRNPFWHTPLAPLVLSLLLSDLFQSLAGTMQLHWLTLSYIHDGTACKLQGGALLFGDVSTAIWEVAIAAVTGWNVVLRKQVGARAVTFIVLGGWMLSIALEIAGPLLLTNPDLMAPDSEWFGISGGWCFITSSHLIPRILIHYLPVFFASFSLLLIYGAIFLSLRGYLVYNNYTTSTGWFGRWSWNWRPTPFFSATGSNEKDQFLRSLSRKMLLYPIFYIILTTPDSASRLAALKGRTAPDWWWWLGMTLFFSMGFVNVIIFCTTRNVLGLDGLGGGGSTGAGSVLISKTTTSSHQHSESYAIPLTTSPSNVSSPTTPRFLFIGGKGERKSMGTRSFISDVTSTRPMAAYTSKKDGSGSTRMEDVSSTRSDSQSQPPEPLTPPPKVFSATHSRDDSSSEPDVPLLHIHSRRGSVVAYDSVQGERLGMTVERSVPTPTRSKVSLLPQTPLPPTPETSSHNDTPPPVPTSPFSPVTATTAMTSHFSETGMSMGTKQGWEAKGYIPIRL